jgi:plasmid stability protein
MNAVEVGTAPPIVVTGLDAAVYRRLRAEAERHGRTVEDEVKSILSAPPHPFWAEARKLNAELAASGRTFSDSADLVREARER